MTTEDRIQALANEIGEAYTAELIPADLAHRWITELTIILAATRFVERDRKTQYAHAQGYY